MKYKVKQKGLEFEIEADEISEVKEEECCGEREQETFEEHILNLFEWSAFEEQIEEPIYTVNGLVEVELLINAPTLLKKKFAWAGNLCTDKSYMDRRRNEIHLYNLLSNYAEMVNEGWKLEWKRDKNGVPATAFTIFWDPDEEIWRAERVGRFWTPNEVFFKTEESARKAIFDIVIPFEKEYGNVWECL